MTIATDRFAGTVSDGRTDRFSGSATAGSTDRYSGTPDIARTDRFVSHSESGYFRSSYFTAKYFEADHFRPQSSFAIGGSSSNRFSGAINSTATDRY